MILWDVLWAVTTYGSTFAMNGLLRYLENPASSVVVPGVWVALLLVAPLLNGTIKQQCEINSIKLIANAKAALIQAIYEKTLRVRISDDEDENEDEGDRIGRINNLWSSDMYTHFPDYSING